MASNIHSTIRPILLSLLLLLTLGAGMAFAAGRWWGGVCLWWLALARWPGRA